MLAFLGGITIPHEVFYFLVEPCFLLVLFSENNKETEFVKFSALPILFYFIEPLASSSLLD